jgi:transposase
MGRAKHCNNEEREIALRLKSEGKSISEIARILARSRNMVLNALKAKNGIDNRGRIRKTSKKEDVLIVRTAKKVPFMTSKEIKMELNLNVSDVTIRRRLLENNLRGCAAQHVPLLSKKNIQARIKFAKKHVANTDPEKWKKVLWSDETKVNIFGSDGRHYVRRPPNASLLPKYTKKTIKHGGGSIMIWGCFSWYGPGPIYWIKQKLNADGYVDILNDVMLEYAESTMPPRWSFQQDNDPKHTSRKAKTWFRENNVDVMEWPAQSPDLNPIENLWGIVKKTIGTKKYKNKNDLWDAIRSAWEEIPVQTCRKLVESMDRRCKEVLNKKGHTTKY